MLTKAYGDVKRVTRWLSAPPSWRGMSTAAAAAASQQRRRPMAGSSPRPELPELPDPFSLATSALGHFSGIIPSVSPSALRCYATCGAPTPRCRSTSTTGRAGGPGGWRHRFCAACPARATSCSWNCMSAAAVRHPNRSDVRSLIGTDNVPVVKDGALGAIGSTGLPRRSSQRSAGGALSRQGPVTPWSPGTCPHCSGRSLRQHAWVWATCSPCAYVSAPTSTPRADARRPTATMPSTWPVARL